MRKLRVGVLAVALVGCVGVALAMHHEPTLEQGKALFNDPQLGTTGKSCNSCHPDGKGLAGAGAKAGLEKTINSCIRASLQGKPLDESSPQMQSLVLYIKSLHKM